MTLAELVEEYLKIHQAAQSTIEKLRWLLSKANGRVRRSADRRPSVGGGLRLARHAAGGASVRGEASTPAVLNAAVAWELIDVNPPRRGVPNPGGRTVPWFPRGDRQSHDGVETPRTDSSKCRIW